MIGRLQTAAGRIAALMLALLLACGCVSLQVRAGRLPDLDPLETELVLGRSTKEDVLAVLGEPVGGGRVSFPIDPGTRKVWTYYYEEGSIRNLTVEDDRRIFLFVFLEEGIYSGYLWFSSLARHQK